MGKIKIVVSDQQPFMIDGIIGFLGHYPDLYEVVGGYKDLKKSIAECNKSALLMEWSPPISCATVGR